MPTYDTSISRDVSLDPLVPTPVAQEIIKEMPKSSVILNNSRRVLMASQTLRQPVLSVLPSAYWVTGDTGLKQTGTADWANVTLTAEELAVLIPIPLAYLDDSQVPIWDEVAPLVVEAIGQKLDAAALFGTDAPSSFPTSIYSGCLAAGNVVVKGAGSTELSQNVAYMGQLLAEDGFNVNGFAAAPGFSWQLVQLRGDDGPIYQPALQDAVGSRLYGFPIQEVANGSWDAGEALLIAGDWTKSIVGVRQDITFTKHTDGIVSDAAGAVVYNAMQQDSVIYRAVFRVGYAIANPETRTNTTDATRYPFGVVQATTANS